MAGNTDISPKSLFGNGSYKQKQNLMAMSEVLNRDGESIIDRTNQDVLQEYNQCAGKGCENEGKIVLAVQYLKRTGHFCESCAEDLLRSGLVVKEVGQ